MEHRQERAYLTDDESRIGVFHRPFRRTLCPAVDVDVRFENRRYASTMNFGPVSFDLHGGLEFQFKELIALRAGYSDVKQLTMGAECTFPSSTSTTRLQSSTRLTNRETPTASRSCSRWKRKSSAA